MPRIKMGRVLGGREPSVRSVSWCKRVQTKFEPYVANGAHRANANMGIYSPTSRHQNIPLHWRGVFMPRIKMGRVLVGREPSVRSALL